MKHSLSMRWWVGLAGAMLLVGCNQPSAPSSVVTESKPAETVETDTPSSSDASLTESAREESAREESAREESAPAETQLSPAQAEATARLELAGIEDLQEAEDFLNAMSVAATQGNKEAIANLIHYPFTTYDTGEPQKEYESPAEFLTDFDQVVTDSVLTAMKTASYDDLFVNYQGAMIGNGAVWFMKYDEGVRIKAINSF
ncbi:MAG: hypothetical protein AB8B99_20695 [Phormidesmis sp.]